MKKIQILLISIIIIGTFGACTDKTTQKKSTLGDSEFEKPPYFGKPKAYAEYVNAEMDSSRIVFEEFLIPYVQDQHIKDWTTHFDKVSSTFFKSEKFKEIFVEKRDLIKPDEYTFLAVNRLKGINPLHQYDFYRFKKYKTPEYTLTATLAKQRNCKEQEDCVYAEILATYTTDGEFIDDFVWWTVKNDTTWTSGDVKRDTLLRGKRKNIGDKELSTIYTKTIITPKGEFKTTFDSNREYDLIDERMAQSKATFDDFLARFKKDDSFKKWDIESQNALVQFEDLFSKNSCLDTFLCKIFQPIAPELYPFIATENIVQLDSFAMITKKPLHKFNFYAFKKIERADYILTAAFANTKVWDGREYYVHPFLLTTYTPKGQIIDSHVWWIVNDDTLEIYDDIAIKGDTFMIVSKNIENGAIEEVFRKTVLHPNGKFETVFTKHIESTL